jgi:RND family efflux transporter MFP subunit
MEKYQGEGGGARYSATIVPLTEVPVAFKVDGYVTSIKQVRGANGKMRNLQGGDTVRAGEVLARIRKVDYTNPVDQQRAQVEQSSAQVKQSRAGESQERAGLQKAQAEQKASQSGLSEAQAGLQQAQHKLSQAQAQERQTQASLSEATASRETAQAQLQGAESDRRQAEAVLEQTRQALREGRATLVARQATQEQTQLEFQRQSNLFKTGSTTKPELDTATRNYDVAKANVEEQTATVARLQAKVKETQEAIQAAQAKIDGARAQLKVSSAKIENATAQVTGAGAAIKAAQADVDGAQAKVDGARQQLAAAGAAVMVQQSKLDAAQAGTTGAQAGVRGAQAGLRVKQVPLSDTELRAPMDGLILKRNIEVGTLYVPSIATSWTAAFTMMDTSQVKAVFGIPDVALSEVRLGETYTVTAEAQPGKQFRGIVTQIRPSADEKSRVFQVEVTIPNPKHDLQSGMIVSLEVRGARLTQAANVVPVAAVVRAPGSDNFAVFVAEESGGKTIARSRPIQTGQVFGGNRIQITGGLQPNDRVIVNGAGILKDGQEIRLQQ